MKRKAKELQMMKRDARKGGRMAYTGGFGGGFGSSDYKAGPMVESLSLPESKPSYHAPPRCVCVCVCAYTCMCLRVCVCVCIACILYFRTRYQNMGMGYPSLS